MDTTSMTNGEDIPSIHLDELLRHLILEDDEQEDEVILIL
jgi:hypothetical protein